MKKAIATTALAALLAVSLSGCTFGLLDPSNIPGEPKPKHENSEQDAPKTEKKSDDAVIADEDTSLTGSGSVQSYVCDDGESLEVTNSNYSSGILDVTGECYAVTISADNLSVFIDSAVSVSVPGYYNTVDLVGAVNDVSIVGDMSTVTGTSVGSLEIEGDVNSVVFDSADSVVVGGNENVVSWFGGTPSGSDTGTGNALLAP